jgi:proteasome lid subunit RPN8/RPN11
MSKYKEINLKAKSKLIISKELQSQIMYLHNKVGNIEWSGMLFHSIVSGNINDPANLVLRAEKVFLQDVGVSTYTEFETSETILDFYDAYPEAVNWKMSMIHTHHNMKCFFSGTDTKELHDNADKYNYYLSLIVNHESQFCAKIAVAAQYNIEKANYTFKGFEGVETIETEGTKSDVLMLIECDIEFEQSEFDIKQYEAIKTKKELEAASKVVSRTYDFGKLDGGFSSTKSFPKTSFDPNYYGYNSSTYGNQVSLFQDDLITAPSPELDELSIRKFLAGFLTLDIANDKMLSDVLAAVNKYNTREKNNYLLELEWNLDSFIDEYFQNLAPGRDTDNLLLKSIDILSKYSAFKVVSDINDLLSIYLSVGVEAPKSTVKAKRKK